MRSTLALLLLFGAVIGVYGSTCTLYTVPQDKVCTIKINWKVHNDNQATATCLEYFPTTFVKGKKLEGTEDGKIECTVEAAYQCVPKPSGDNSETFLMFDKCYYFPKRSAKEYVDGTVKEYEQPFVAGDLTKGRKLCNGGKLSVFYSHTHAKFLGMKANSLGIKKLWIGINKDGTSIEEPGMKIHSKLWKLVEGDYWDLEQGKPVLKRADPSKIKYYFMRTRNDQFNNRFQGSFEQATEKIKATFACEFEAKFTAHQQWYCDKMRIMGIDAVYDDEHVSNGFKSRCLYVSANKYSWDGTYDEMKNKINKGCGEKPSALHSAGMDDGTGSVRNYIFKDHKDEKLRLAAYIVERDLVKEPWPSFGWFGSNTILPLITHDKCDSAKPDATKKFFLSQKWRYLNHHGKIMNAAFTKLKWHGEYPQNECSDFPGFSSTLGLKDGQLIDMPTEVRAPAVCSLTFFQECENTSPCGDLECKNTKTFKTNTNSDTILQGFFTCQCPGPKAQLVDIDSMNPLDVPYIENEINGKKICDWNPVLGEYCAWLRFWDGTKEYSAPLSKAKAFYDFSKDTPFKNPTDKYNDLLDQVVVRKGCTARVRAASDQYEYKSGHPNFDLLTDAGYGTHEVPVPTRGTMAEHNKLWAASNAACSCA